MPSRFHVQRESASASTSATQGPPAVDLVIPEMQRDEDDDPVCWVIISGKRPGVYEDM